MAHEKMKEADKVVSVRWVDITSHEDVPSTGVEYKELLARCESIGRLIHQNDEIVVLSNQTTSIPDVKGEDEDIHRDIMIIPQGVILEINEFREEVN